MDLKKFLSAKKNLLLVSLVVLIFAGGVLYVQNEKKKISENPQLAANQDIEKVVAKVSKLIELPENETPTLATVSDKEKLKDQPFFKNAQNGDKVLIYQDAKKAILYRPSTNKIIEVAPINLGGLNQEATKTPDQSTSPTVKPLSLRITVYNGTQTAGLAAQTETQIEGKFSQIEVVSKANSTDNYTKTLVVE